MQFLTQADSTAWRDGQEKIKAVFITLWSQLPGALPHNATALFPVRRPSLGQGPSSAPALVGDRVTPWGFLSQSATRWSQSYTSIPVISSYRARLKRTLVPKGNCMSSKGDFWFTRHPGKQLEGKAVLQHKPQILQQDNSSKIKELSTCYPGGWRAAGEEQSCPADSRDWKMPALAQCSLLPPATNLCSSFLGLPAASLHVCSYQKCPSRVKTNSPQPLVPVIHQRPEKLSPSCCRAPQEEAGSQISCSSIYCTLLNLSNFLHVQVRNSPQEQDANASGDFPRVLWNTHNSWTFLGVQLLGRGDSASPCSHRVSPGSGGGTARMGWQEQPAWGTQAEK